MKRAKEGILYQVNTLTLLEPFSFFKLDNEEQRIHMLFCEDSINTVVEYLSLKASFAENSTKHYFEWIRLTDKNKKLMSDGVNLLNDIVKTLNFYSFLGRDMTLVKEMSTTFIKGLDELKKRDESSLIKKGVECFELGYSSYVLVSGHRRKVACELLGIETMPVLVREMTDDQANVLMVDSNLQREHILPSERAFAYKMKLDAIRRSAGRPKNNSSQVGTNYRSDLEIAEQSGDSRNQVQRYIRLTNLVQPILRLVDENKIALTPAVEISYLSETEQNSLLESMECEDCTPSLSQAQKLKKLSQEGHLNADVIYSVLTEDKPNQKEQLKFRKDSIKKCFPKDYSTTQMEEVIVKLLADWQRKRDSKNRDYR